MRLTATGLPTQKHPRSRAYAHCKAVQTRPRIGARMSSPAHRSRASKPATTRPPTLCSVHPRRPNPAEQREIDSENHQYFVRRVASTKFSKTNLARNKHPAKIVFHNIIPHKRSTLHFSLATSTLQFYFYITYFTIRFDVKKC